MHSRDKGKSGSTKPEKKIVPSWIRYKKKEVEMLITKLAKEGKSASRIGLELRDRYGVPDVKTLTGKKVNKILEEKKLNSNIPEDLMALMKKSIKIRSHLENNHHDQPANRGLKLTESKIKRLIKYYKNAKKLPIEWKYDANKLRLLIE